MHNASDGAQLKTDWDVVRSAALACLDAVQKLKSYADDSQGNYYNDKVVAMHLAAIKEAEIVFSQSWTTVSNFGDTVFDQLLLAQTVGEAARPDFRFSATAHEASLVLLGETVRWVNIGLGDALVSIGARDFYNGAIQDLHLCSPEQLRDALCHSEKSKPLQSLFDRMQTQPFIRLRAWIDREWAAVATITNVGGTSQRSPNQTTSAKDSEESSNAIEVPQVPSLREILTTGLSDGEMNMLAKLIELEQQYSEQPADKSNPLWRKRYDANDYQKERELKGKRNLAVIARRIFEAEKDRMQNLNVQ